MTAPETPVSIDVDQSIWERFFTVAPLVLIGTRDSAGVADMAPKHMVTPLGWDNYFGFVCTPRHKTWQNVEAGERFTVSYPRPDQLLFASLTATPRCDDDSKPVLDELDTFPAPDSGLPMLAKAYLWFDCEMERVVTGFGDNGLICGKIVAAYAATDALRHSEVDSDTQLNNAPLLTYVHPGRFSVINSSYSFPFPAGMEK